MREINQAEMEQISGGNPIEGLASVVGGLGAIGAGAAAGTSAGSLAMGAVGASAVAISAGGALLVVGGVALVGFGIYQMIGD
jgi:hypothetical protein